MKGDSSHFLKVLEMSKEKDALYIAKATENSILILSKIRPTFKLRLTVKKTNEGKEMKKAILKLFEKNEEVD
ncbi:MAG: hypothetical protein ACP5RE_03805 [Candidatus Acidifodinimicrobium sp.]